MSTRERVHLIVPDKSRNGTAQKEAGTESAAVKCARANLAAASEALAAQDIANGSANAKAAPTSGLLPAVPDTRPQVKSALELAIDRLTALADKSDRMVVTKWGKRNASILAESLNFMTEYAAASEAEQKAVRKSLKAKSGVSREPNVDNLPVIAVYMGVSCGGEKRTKAQRKEWCRFATVVKVAARASIKPENAAEWLEKQTLNGILAEWRDVQKADGKGARKAAVPKALKNYAHLAAALANGSTFRDLAKDELAKADAAVAKAMSEAAVKAPANGSLPAHEVPVDA